MSEGHDMSKPNEGHDVTTVETYTGNERAHLVY